MNFLSTRGGERVESAAKAITEGLAKDGGLFVPETFPVVSPDELNKMLDMDYAERAALVIGKYLEEYDKEELLSACKKAYGQFEDGDATPVVKIDDKLFVLELFHGPTLAFKDIALTLLPYLLRKGADICGIKEEILILVATSGDTGKAALSGFCNQDRIKIMVFYPSEGVSDMQKLQMCTQEGDNVNVVGVNGNFDDCQTAVKKIFSDVEYNKLLKEKGVILSSANSINFGRLVPQIAYYFSAYSDLVSSNEIKMGDKVNFAVPTGNFGNILAGFYAKKMGLPIDKLICASNSNNVLTEFFNDGEYDKNREFYKTVSPSMDILVSSNLERLIFENSGRNADLTKERMEELKKTGKYAITKNELNDLKKDFVGFFADEEDCKETLAYFFEEYGYLTDTHTAVCLKAVNDFRSFCDNKLNTIALSTASAYKFPQSVYKFITGKKINDAFTASEKLEEISACPLPTKITDLKTKEKRFDSVAERDNLKDEVTKFINK